MKLKDKKVGIFGLGKSGIAAARFLVSRGASVRISETRPVAEVAKLIKNSGIAVEKYEAGGHTESFLENLDLIVVCPGIPPGLKVLAKARTLGIKIIGELELAAQHIDAPVIAVSGTNGKTTTCTLIGEMIARAGKKVIVGGNIGFPLTQALLEKGKPDFVVAEVSSFQLESIDKFKPRVAVLLNLTPDHIDRHGSYGNYVQVKKRMFINQGAEDYAVLNYDNPDVWNLRKEIRAQAVPFSRQRQLKRGTCIRKGTLIWTGFSGAKENIVPTGAILLRGEHNRENALAAAAAARLVDIPCEVIRDVLTTFKSVEHRIEPVAVIDGVEYINDSKGTNEDSSICAIRAMPGPIVLIAGGYDKGSDFKKLAAEIKKKTVKKVILTGATAEKIRVALQNEGYYETETADNLTEAVELARKKAKSGDYILFSPACASFDRFKNFEERGRFFKKLVKQINER